MVFLSWLYSMEVFLVELLDEIYILWVFSVENTLQLYVK